MDKQMKRTSSSTIMPRINFMRKKSQKEYFLLKVTDTTRKHCLIKNIFFKEKH